MFFVVLVDVGKLWWEVVEVELKGVFFEKKLVMCIFEGIVL